MNTHTTTPDTAPDIRRDCHRLTAIIAARGTAQSLDMHELIRLSDWVTPPACPTPCDDWAETIAVPLIQELGRRLAHSMDTQQVEIPNLLTMARRLRSLQRLLAKAKPENRGELRKAVADVETEFDAILNADLQPSLFEPD